MSVPRSLNLILNWLEVLALIAAFVMLVLGVTALVRISAPDPSPTGLTTTTVNMPSGRMVECVLARDAGPTGLSVAVDCDFGR